MAPPSSSTKKLADVFALFTSTFWNPPDFSGGILSDRSPNQWSVIDRKAIVFVNPKFRKRGSQGGHLRQISTG